METSIRPDTLVVLSVMFLVILLPVALAISPWKSKIASRLAAFLLGLSAVVLVFLAVVFDEMLGISASWVFTLVIFVLGCGTCLAVRRRYRSIFALVIIGLLMIFVLVQHFMDLSPVKPYRRFFGAIKPGMTESEVLSLLTREFPDGFRFPRPVRRDSAQRRMDFFLDPEESAWNNERISVHFSDGRVDNKEYSRD